ncbi:MAG TPA: hypothetical protein VIK01_04620 [Polyangiaceae bacterium]
MRTDQWQRSWLCAFGVALSFLTGCPGKLEDKERFLVDAGNLDEPDTAMPSEAGVGMPSEAGVGMGMGACGDVPTRIFVPTCGGTGCHSVTAPQQGLDLASPGVAARVVGVAAKVCSGTLADPANPAGSLIYTKLAPTQSCGAPMPLARPPLSDTDAACVLAWIAAQ